MSEMSDNTQVLVAIAELKGEVVQANRYAADHEARIRTLEARPEPDAETDRRIKQLEDTAGNAITLKQLWWGLGSVMGVAVTAFIIFDRIKVAIIGG